VSGSLVDIRHLVFILAEHVPAREAGDLASRSTQCRAYHVSPRDEDAAVLWAGYLGELRTAGYSAASTTASELIDGISNSALGEITVLGAEAREIEQIVRAIEATPDVASSTLLAIALGDGEALPVAVEGGGLGEAGLLLLVSPWTPPGWVSEEVFDHTSVMRFCESWTDARGRHVRASIPNWRRTICGDLHRVIELRDAAEVGPLPSVAGRLLARPVPYFPAADLRIGESGVTLRLANLGPIAASPAPLLVIDSGETQSVVVAGSPLDDQSWVRIPVAIDSGRYDVTVSGPNHFHRRFAGSFPDTGVHCTADYFGRDPWFPSLTLTVRHDQNMPIFFWMEKRLGERAASKAAGYGSGILERLPGPRQTARFKEEPGANTFGWYDVAVTTSADAEWVREYAGHMPTGVRPTLDY
jgi:phospholipase C